MAVAGINAGPGLTTTHDANVTPGMQGIAGTAPNVMPPARLPPQLAALTTPASAGGGPPPMVPPAGTPVPAGTALSLSQALLGPATLGGNSGPAFSIEAGGQVIGGGAGIA